MSNHTGMSIEEAIVHAKQVAQSCSAGGVCAYHHDKLVEWLEELQRYRTLKEQGHLVILPENSQDTQAENALESFLLISVCERDIETSEFPNLKAAQDAMLKELQEYGGVQKPEFGMSDTDYEITETSAWSNVHSDMKQDWLIVSVGPGSAT